MKSNQRLNHVSDKSLLEIGRQNDDITWVQEPIVEYGPYTRYYICTTMLDLHFLIYVGIPCFVILCLVTDKQSNLISHH